MKPLAIIILNWNGLNLLKEFLPGVARHSISPRTDVIVADNGSNDGSVAWIRQRYPEVRVIELGQNLGFAAGYNRAIELAGDYRYVTLLNSDVEVEQGWWQPLLGFMERNPEVGAIQPKILSQRHKGMFEYAGAAGGYLDALGYPYCRGRLFDSIEADRGQYDGAPEDVAWASGACLTVRRDLYLQLGGLDAAFFAHMEEIDLCCRIWRAGYRVCAVTDSKVFHVGGASLRQGNPEKTYLNFRNNLLLLHKNLPSRKGKRILLLRRLADTLAWAMFLVKGDTGNAAAILRAHRDFKRMRGLYGALPDTDILKRLPGSHRLAVAARYLLRRKSLKP